jgi:pimeloyl-ACP methyl ester carboxylesterase
MSVSTLDTDSTATDLAIRPFRIDVPEEALVDLRRRIAATRWPDEETVADRSQGAQLAKMRELVSYWGTDYDWRKAEAKLNALPQFVTEIDGVDIQFAHLRSPHPEALPLIVTHGWPGSVLELLKVAGPLTDPTAYGGRAEDAFHLVLPSLPDYGFSGKPRGTDWGPAHIATAWDELMRRLGYEHYVSQGGDWGAIVSHFLASIAPAGLLGIHVNMPATVPADVAKLLADSEPAPAGLTDSERAAFDALAEFNKTGSAYAAVMFTVPHAGLRTGGFTGRVGGLDVRQVRRLDRHRRRPRAGAEQGRDARRHHALLADQHRYLVLAALLGSPRRQPVQCRRDLDPGRGHRVPR